MSLLIKNARLITPGIDAEGVAVLVEGKRIADVFYAGEELPKAEFHKILTQAFGVEKIHSEY